MVLKDLIEALEAADQTHVPAVGFGNPHSYRGDYSELAFEPKYGVTIADMLRDARSALGTTYTAYKGGLYTMNEWTTCNLAEHGECGEEIGPVLLGYMCGRHAA